MSESLTYDNLIAGSQRKIVSLPATIRLSEAFPRGALLSRITATGKWQEASFANIAACNGWGIASEAVDSTLAEVQTSVYVEGEFATSAVTFYYSDLPTDWAVKLQSVGIYLRATISTDGV